MNEVRPMACDSFACVSAGSRVLAWSPWHHHAMPLASEISHQTASCLLASLLPLAGPISPLQADPRTTRLPLPPPPPRPLPRTVARSAAPYLTRVELELPLPPGHIQQHAALRPRRPAAEPGPPLARPQPRMPFPPPPAAFPPPAEPQTEPPSHHTHTRTAPSATLLRPPPGRCPAPWPGAARPPSGCAGRSA